MRRMPAEEASSFRILNFFPPSPSSLVFATCGPPQNSIENAFSRGPCTNCFRLAKNPKPVKVETVDEESTMIDSSRTIMLYHVAGNPHSDTMLMAYLPKEKILFTADFPAPVPGQPVSPSSTRTYSGLFQRLSVTRAAMNRVSISFPA